jgi:hypothetical protein
MILGNAPTKYQMKEYMREKAEAECTKACPWCGENEDLIDNLNKGIYNKGIDRLGFVVQDVPTGFLGLRKTLQSTCYSCHTCGGTWQSDPYEK